ncbi:MAG: arsenical pump-driving ATPase GET3 [Nanoarchaeota archaeon]|nr:arsenical pump-driving ATPase GET3 [Nanoarchaeota archaeon]MBU1135126.1 arsenical pump-driving ATPase GET3 [Nanoarchaeota archaeon]MBU2520136.1 arsenical pump-driving ATPase GET3 [Nanoarchaeota archaeon]
MLGLKKERDPLFLFFSGKGGVGKTSVAAASALYHSNQGKKVLIISTDPAHSLSDSFEIQIGGEIKEIKKNLFAVEIDPVKAMGEYKEKFMPQLEKMEMLKGLGIEDTFDFASMTPGIDEIAAFDKFLQYMEKKEYDIIIFDTAPTGHALRFLSLPDVLDSWIGKMISFRMKFAGIANIFKKILPFGDSEEQRDLGTKQLDEMKKRIEHAKALLSDPKKTFYNIVLIPEDMSIVESKRSLSVLDQYKINVGSIIVNQLIPENSSCKFCQERRNHQQKRLEKINKEFEKFNVLQLPLFQKEVHGFETLSSVASQLYGK